MPAGGTAEGRQVEAVFRLHRGRAPLAWHRDAASELPVRMQGSNSCGTGARTSGVGGNEVSAVAPSIWRCGWVWASMHAFVRQAFTAVQSRLDRYRSSGWHGIRTVAWRPHGQSQKTTYAFVDAANPLYLSGPGFVVLMPHGACHGRGGMRVVSLCVGPHGDSS